MRWTSGLLERIDPAYRAVVKSSRVTKPNPFHAQSRQGTEPAFGRRRRRPDWLTDGSRTLAASTRPRMSQSSSLEISLSLNRGTNKPGLRGTRSC
jgi:hypothetical protein